MAIAAGAGSPKKVTQAADPHPDAGDGVAGPPADLEHMPASACNHWKGKCPHHKTARRVSFRSLSRRSAVLSARAWFCSIRLDTPMTGSSQLPLLEAG